MVQILGLAEKHHSHHWGDQFLQRLAALTVSTTFRQSLVEQLSRDVILIIGRLCSDHQGFR